MNDELKQALTEMAEGLENKSAEQIKEEMKAFEGKFDEFTKANDLTNAEVKEMKNAFDIELKAIQDHVNKLDVKLKETKKMENKGGDQFKSFIRENVEKIANVRKGSPVEFKAVGDMTLGNNLTGDEPRDYNFDVVTIPGQLINVADLIPSIAISGGTYTFVREGAGEGSIAAQTEGSAKSQRDYDFTHVDVTTDFIAGFARYSRKMKNNLPYLESFLPQALRRDYWIAENSAFNTVLAGAATASSQVITGQNKIEMLIAEIATLEASNFAANRIVVTPADYYDILVTEKSTGAGYGLPGIVTMSNGSLFINGVQVVRANWLAANKYYVGDWSRVRKVVTEGLGVAFSEEDGDNFVKNNITARVEAQVALAVEQPAAVIYGDFTAA